MDDLNLGVLKIRAWVYGLEGSRGRMVTLLSVSCTRAEAGGLCRKWLEKNPRFAEALSDVSWQANAVGIGPQG